MWKWSVPLCLSVVVGCGSSGDPQTPDSQPRSLPKSQLPKPKNLPTNEDYGIQSSIPKGAQYTIFCASVRGDFHVERTNKMKKDLVAATGMKDWYVVSEDGQSTLYYGYYRVIRDSADKAESDRAQRDRLKIDQMTDPMGNRPFASSMFVRLDAPDPDAPPEWNLALAKGYWTIEIGAYKDSPDRKKAAVDSVRTARAQGIEAYYFHGPTASSVCVGAWPKEAVKAQDKGHHGAESRDPDKTILVLPPGMPDELIQRATAAGKERNMEVLQPKLEVVDRSLLDAMKQYPTYAVNGMVETQNVNGVAQAKPSMLALIPQDPTRMAARESTPSQQQQYDPNYRPDIPRQTPQRPPNPTGTGRLKSFGEK